MTTFQISVTIGIFAALACTFISFVIGSRMGYKWHEDDMREMREGSGQ